MILLTQKAEVLGEQMSEEMVLEMYRNIISVAFPNKYRLTVDDVKRNICICVAGKDTSILEHHNITMKLFTSMGTYRDLLACPQCAFTMNSTYHTNFKEFQVIVGRENDPVLSIIEKLEFEAKVFYTREMVDYLPQCIATNVMMSTSIKQWRYIIGLLGNHGGNMLTIRLRNLIWMELNKHFPFFFPLGIADEGPMTIYNQWGAGTIAYIDDICYGFN
jgi:hypothetical protein